MSLYPEIEIESDELLMTFTIKRDYSKIDDINLRKKEFFKDLNNLIKEFDEAPESIELMEYYDD
ncbi:hypothetical protein [Methanobrevibacter sp. DSM 116169]|uniref:hypothetical protein n=1 Tax=Methanobrevibacter sp. DSM 116169 TaxID=3242727 RepID=UPI0038FBE5DC